MKNESKIVHVCGPGIYGNVVYDMKQDWHYSACVLTEVSSSYGFTT